MKIMAKKWGRENLKINDTMKPDIRRSESKENIIIEENRKYHEESEIICEEEKSYEICEIMRNYRMK